MIGKLKYFDGKTPFNEILENNDSRFSDITKEFVDRKNKLLSNESVYTKHIEKLLICSNIFYVREKCFFSEEADLFYSDFYIPLIKTTIEIDGGYHNTVSRKYLDEIKEEFLCKRKIATVRITNEQSLKLDKINLHKLIETANYRWKNKNSEEYEEWRRLSSLNKEEAVNQLKSIFREQLRTLKLDSNVILYFKDGKEIVYDNIFQLHFATEIKFKEVLKRLNNFNSRLKYNIKLAHLKN